MNFYLMARRCTRNIIWMWWREAVRRRRLDLWWGKKWLLHHDKAPAHSSLLIHDSFAKHEMKLVPQTLHSPNPAWADFCLNQAEIRTERTIWVCWGNKRKFARRATEYSERSIPWILPKLEETLGAIYKNGGEHFEGDKAQ